jgi:hypothetical protein
MTKECGAKDGDRPTDVFDEEEIEQQTEVEGANGDETFKPHAPAALAAGIGFESGFQYRREFEPAKAHARKGTQGGIDRCLDAGVLTGNPHDVRRSPLARK